MTQLEHATFEEITAELSKRYISYVLVIKHARDAGRPPAVRIEQFSRDKCLSDTIGLAKVALIALEALQLKELRIVGVDKGLDS